MQKKSKIGSPYCARHSGVIDTAVTKIGEYKVDLMKKTRGQKSRVRVPLMDSALRLFLIKILFSQ
jgi:hypothetical protein